MNTTVYPGDLVEVKSPDEILETLDSDGALDGLPFMPEMAAFCGLRFRVHRRAGAICFSGAGSPRGFTTNDVVTFDGVRCSGAAHDGCEKACTIFWREAWLRKIEYPARELGVNGEAAERLQCRLTVSTAPDTYYCQASELPKATHSMTRWERLENLCYGLIVGNFSVKRLVQDLVIWLSWKVRWTLLGRYPLGSSQPTPTENLNLQPGDWVEVKPLDDIIETLNEKGQNRALNFSADMRLSCGRRYKVKGRLDKIIVDGTGQMRKLRNTVCLEGSTCGCAYMGFGMGGCARCELTYWREIWLRRLDGGELNSQSHHSTI